MTSFYILKLGRRLFEILLAYLGANQVCMIGSFIIIATMSCERYFNIMAYTGTMCWCNFFTKKIANIFTWTAVWIIAICLSMPILINSRIIQVREQIQCKVTWEYVPKDICEDQVYSRLISMDESMKSNITSCPQSGISKCSLGLDSRYSMTTVERPVHAVNFTVNWISENHKRSFNIRTYLLDCFIFNWFPYSSFANIVFLHRTAVLCPPDQRCSR